MPTGAVRSGTPISISSDIGANEEFIFIFGENRPHKFSAEYFSK
jgi:hypothetical protein